MLSPLLSCEESAEYRFIETIERTYHASGASAHSRPQTRLSLLAGGAWAPETGETPFSSP